MSLCVPPCCLSGLCYDCISNLLPEMNTQMAAADHQSSPQPRRMAALCGSSRGKVIQNKRIPSVHYTLPWKQEKQEPKLCI